MGQLIRFWCFCIGVVVLLVSPTAPAMGFSVGAPDPSTQKNLGAQDSFFISPELPDPERPDQLIDRVRRELVFAEGDLLTWIHAASAMQERVRAGETSEGADARPSASLRPTRDRWILLSVGLLLLIGAILKSAFPVDTALLFRAHYDRSLLGQIAKEDHLFSSWPFFFLYIFTGFAVGIFSYLTLISGVFEPPRQGPPPYVLVISASVLVLFGLKIATIRLIGFIFDISRMLRKYITVLYLAYFNAGIILLLFAFVISLVPYAYAPGLVWTAVGAVAVMLLLRIVQVAAEMLINYRFPKFYLFMYLCTLEIAPVLILIKVLYR